MTAASPSHRPSGTVWLTGLSGSGKTTLASRLHHDLLQHQIVSIKIDGDALRAGINSDLGFSKEDRFESVRRAGEFALAHSQSGIVSICSLVSPYAASRDLVRARHAQRGVPFVEVYVSCAIATCEMRDPKGLYRRARSGEISMMTGVDDPYEPPISAEVEIPTDLWDVERCSHYLLTSILMLVSRHEQR